MRARKTKSQRDDQSGRSDGLGPGVVQVPSPERSHRQWGRSICVKIKLMLRRDCELGGFFLLLGLGCTPINITFTPVSLSYGCRRHKLSIKIRVGLPMSICMGLGAQEPSRESKGEELDTIAV